MREITPHKLLLRNVSVIHGRLRNPPWQEVLNLKIRVANVSMTGIILEKINMILIKLSSIKLPQECSARAQGCRDWNI